MKKAKIDRSIFGTAGEYIVAGTFQLRGMIANLGPRNLRFYDVLVTSPDGLQHANVQVKTVQDRKTCWPICKTVDKVRISRYDFYVLLRPTAENASTLEGYMLTGEEMKVELERDVQYRIDKNQKNDFYLCVDIHSKGWMEQEKIDLWRERWEYWTLDDIPEEDKWQEFIHQREEPQPEEDESFKDQYYISSKGEVIKEEFLKSGMFKGEFYNPEINGPDELVEESKPTLKIAAHYKLERVVSYLRNEPHGYEERSQHRGNSILEIEWAARQLYFDMSADEKFFMDHSWGHDSDHNYSDDLIEQTAALEKKLWE